MRQLVKFDPSFNSRVPQVSTMKNVYEVLRQKELELARLEKEVEALRVAAPLLSDDKDAAENKPALTATASPQQPIRMAQPAVNAAPQTARAAGWDDTAKRWP
ncbi:MAG TPA: hypothetical protein VGV15_14375 [Terriglobales bacterium]|jgi:hypothetical protein|nr:hypothetical protein [Terriglobales bacterium]